MATVDLFIKSYSGDYWLLEIALQTIKKNLTGYKNIVLLIPARDKDKFDTRDLPDRTLIFYVEDEGSGWLRQQVYKLKAHEYSTADFIAYSDSDAFVSKPLDLQTLINDGKPEILHTDWSLVADAIVWKEPTEKVLGEPVPFETMRRLGLCYHRSTLENLNKFEPNLEAIIMNSSRFSEFNLLGAYANKFEKEKYTWTDTANWEYVPPHFAQVWSHSSKKAGASETHHLEYIRLLETIMGAFNCPVPKP